MRLECFLSWSLCLNLRLKLVFLPWLFRVVVEHALEAETAAQMMDDIEKYESNARKMAAGARGK